MAK
ncbi:unnamed protein product [Linum tenue]|jgi:hypothetical protein